MNIHIAIENEAGDTIFRAEAPTIELAIEKLGEFERREERKREVEIVEEINATEV